MLGDSVSELRAFIVEQLHRGVNIDELREALMREGGWTKEDLDQVLAGLHQLSPVQSHAADPGGGQQTPIEASTPPHPVGASAPSGQVSSSAPWSQSTATSAAPPDAVHALAHDPYLTGAAPAATAGGPHPTPDRSYAAKMAIIGVGVLILGGGASAAYYYAGQSGLLSGAPYDETDLAHGLLMSAADIKTASYQVTASLEMEPRDRDAQPYAPRDAESLEKKQAAYERDRERIQDVDVIHDALLYEVEYGESVMSGFAPDTYTQLRQRGSFSDEYGAWPMGRGGGQSDESTDDSFLVDPLTKKEYGYRVVDGGADFELVIELETPEAVEAVQQYQERYAMYSLSGEDQSSVRVDGTTVTFNRDSAISSWLLESELPKPLFLQLSDYARLLPPELKGSFSMSARASLEDVEQADWEISFDSDMDMGDMTYKVAGDARKVDEALYFRIRNIPGLYLSLFGLEKNIWITMPLVSTSSESTGTMFDFYGEAVAEATEEYKQERDEYARFVLRTTELADEMRLFSFRSAPSREQVGDRLLWRYELSVNKNALVPFLEKLNAEAEAMSSSLITLPVADAALLAYLKSAEFDDLFAYLDSNVRLVLHTDDVGHLAQMSMSIRVVPPDTAEQLADKQARVSFVFGIDDINEPVVIDVPPDAVPIEEVIEKAKKNFEFGSESELPGVSSAAHALGGFLNAMGR